MRAAFLIGCMVFPFCSWKSVESQRSAIATQPDCCGDKHCGEEQPQPQARRTEVLSRRQRWAVDRVHGKGEGLRCESHQTIFQHRGEMRSAERDLFKKANREKWHYSAKKRRPPCPTRNQKRPAIDRRVP